MSKGIIERIELNDIKKVYLSDIFGRVSLNGIYTTNEWKLAFLIFSRLNQGAVILSKDYPDVDSFEHPLIKKLVDETDNNVYIKRDEFIEITDTDKTHAALMIKKVTESLIDKSVTLPNPIEPNNKKSFLHMSLFSLIQYEDRTGMIKVKVNEDALPFILFMKSYTLFRFTEFILIKNKHAINIYIFAKIAINKYSKVGELYSSIEDLRQSLGLEDKYRSVNSFIKSVIDVSISEINNKTDINIFYELHKTGKRFTHITLKFSQKKDTSKQIDQPKRKPQEIEYQGIDAPLNLDINDQGIIIAAQLQSYGIPRNKALEYVRGYGEDACKLGIEKLLGEIQKGRDIKNISGYLVSCIENAGNNSSSQEIKAAIDAAEELAQDRKAQEMERFNSFDTYLNNNEQQILVLLARHEANEKLTDELEIDMLRCLKDVVAQYEDLESMSPYYLTLRFKDDILNYATIKSLVEELEVATKEERIAKLKAELEAKKVELKEVSGKAKGLVEKEITMLKVAIADLV